MSAVIPFPVSARGADLVRAIATERGYGPVVAGQLARTFRPDNVRPLRVQASQHVREPDESATAFGDGPEAA
ncbi:MULTISPECIES: hypothetical protein [Xanthomonas]|uniref:Uncharacterized protein n=1 Tax=Xanthomonas floridensis TaxID=1843580 RepID=A0A1A9MC12_9XANT|nr:MULTISPECIES: hypothetical protein [Xanthomonas]MBB5675551.1 hypothetical protein [Xanthomonas arboricola]MEA5123271.1 hypothetical protein [Xanthomonas floridensis]MEA5132762.1 hypothetical protein [Xanthomonas floridensis]OAG67672.1 hypothetical protein A7D17_15905 [Xanthomonas floridensis]